ncbi:hypothetical protein [Xanthomonas hortorum]|uniref:hypothetical protein n=1 Tax=Xanthomonas hortorum TaxID=56454 RepID=UPI003F7D1305
MTSPISITTLAALASAGVLRGTGYGVCPPHLVVAPRACRRARPAALRAWAKFQRGGKPAKPKPARKPAGVVTVATAAKILPSDRAQLKLPGLPRTRKAARATRASP